MFFGFGRRGRLGLTPSAACPRPLLSLLIAGGAALAVGVGIQPSTATIAAQPAGKSAARRFFDSFNKRPEPEQQFIAAPTPPPAAAEPAAKKVTELVPPKAAGPAAPKAAEPAVRKPAVRIGQVPPPASTVKTAPPRPITWKETLDFTTSMQAAAGKVAAAAIDPKYRPAPKPTAAKSGAAKPQQGAAASNPAGSKPAAGKPANTSTTSRHGSGPQPPQTKRFERLRTQIAQTLATYQKRPLNSAQHTPWEVMHGFIAFGIPSQVRVGGPAGALVNSIGWMNMGGRCRGQVMLATIDDRLVAMKGIGVQGHSAQYLAILAQCRVALTSPITIQSKSFTVADLVEEEKRSCKSNTELTFALIGLAHYLPTDSEWKARDGKLWTLEKLVAEEIEQPIRGAPCGGTHRLYGLAYGCQRRLKATGRLDGHYARADKFVRDYQKFTLTKLQNRDGSFSTEWFKYPADRENDIDRKVQTTGHILEWLAGSLDQDDLYDPRVVDATEFLAKALAREPSREWKIGPMGHALHALTIYQERAWGVVLPGSIAAYHGPMKAAADTRQIAAEPERIRLPDDTGGAKPIRR